METVLLTIRVSINNQELIKGYFGENILDVSLYTINLSKTMCIFFFKFHCLDDINLCLFVSFGIQLCLRDVINRRIEI